MTPTPRLLVVVAHPDDEVLLCGGTMHKWRTYAHVLILGEGPYGRQVRAHAAEAAGILGTSIRYAGLTDQRFDTYPLVDLITPVEQAVREWQPTLVITHHPADVNRDHQLTAEAVSVATRGCAYHGDVWAGFVPGSTDWAWAGVKPSVYVSLSPRDLEAKLAAMAAYPTEDRPAPHPRSQPLLRAAAHVWGSHVLLDAAEVFTCVRAVR